MIDKKYIVEFSDEEMNLILGSLEYQVEYGRSVDLVRRIIGLYDKLNEIWYEETTLNE